MKIMTLLITIALFTYIYDSVNFKVKDNEVRIRISGQVYGKKGNITVPDEIVKVKEGEVFGPEKIVFTSNPKPFKLLEIIDNDQIKVEFDKEIIVDGEPINEPSKQNPIIIKSTYTLMCFRTRTYDAGATICLHLLKPE